MEIDENNDKKTSEKLKEEEARENIDRQKYEQRNEVEALHNQEARDGQLTDNTEDKQENAAMNNKNVFEAVSDRDSYEKTNALEARQNQEERSENLFSKLEPMVADYQEMLNLTEDQKNEMLANVIKEADRNPDIGEMQKLAASDIYHEYTQTPFKFETREGETPIQAFDRKLEEMGFHKGEHENSTLEILDGLKGDHDYQRFMDIDGGLQEHIRFNEPVENADGSYSVTIIGESHRNSNMEAVYDEGTFGDLEPSRHGIEHFLNTLHWIGNRNT